MSFTFVVKGANGGGAGPLTSVAVTLAGIHVGDLVVVCLKHEDAAATGYGCADSGGSGSASTFVLDPDGRGGGASGDNTFFAYTLSSQRSGSVTYTWSWTGSKAWPGIIAMAYTPSGTASFGDSNTTNGNAGAGGAIASPNITLGADNVAFGFYGEVSSIAATSTLINGVASDQSLTDNNTGQLDTMWSKVNASGFTGPAAGTLISGSGLVYTIGAMGFTNTGAADTLLGQGVM